MKFPFVTRAHHEEVVRLLRSQITGLARTIYAGGEVPEEFQLLLGIHIEPKSASIAPERELTEDEKALAEMKAEQARDLAALARIKRTRPSQLGTALAAHMEKWGARSALAASKPSPISVSESDAASMFAQAAADAEKQFSDA